MPKLTADECFEKFIEYYKDKTYEDEFHIIHKCYDKIEELSRSGTSRGDSLIPNSQKMYCLDGMVKYSKKLSINPPKSTDALLFRQNYDGRYALHIIEFKFLGFTHQDKINWLWRDMHKKISCENSQDIENNERSSDDDCEIEKCFEETFVRNLDDVRDKFKDPVAVSLQLKPYEVIYITLPLLYEEYCDENPDVTKIDIVSYLNNIDKYYWAFVGNRSSSRYNINSKVKKLNKYSERLERTIFKKARVNSNHDFDEVLDREILENFDFGF